MNGKRPFALINSFSSGAETESVIDDSIDEDEDDKYGVLYVSPLGRRFEGCTIIDQFQDGNGNVHRMAKFPVVQTGKNMKKRARVQPCKDCGRETTVFCVECNKPFCHSYGNHGHGRTCFHQHIPTHSCARLSSIGL